MTTIKGKKDLFPGIKIAVPLVFYLLALFVPRFISVSSDSYLATTIRIAILVIGLLLLIPLKIGIPTREGGFGNLVIIGLGWRKVLFRHIILGVIIGLTSLLFMFLGSYITGGYVFDLTNVSSKHLYFSLVPGVFEEVVFRGYIMIGALQIFKTFKKAAIFQILVFTISHLKDFSVLGIIDMITVAVIAIVFTYVVFRTGHLYTAIIFHFIHDAFLFLAQKPDSAYSGFMDHMVFYIFIWIGMAAIIYLTKSFTKKEFDKNKYISFSLLKPT